MIWIMSTGRGRHRDEAVRLAIVEAAGRLLFERGYRDFTIEAVAAGAGASKGTIYKWWPSKGALALDGYSAAVEYALAFPETGDPRADLLSQLNALITTLTTTASGRAIRELIGAAQFDPPLGELLRERYFRPYRELGHSVLRRLLGPDATDDRLKAAGTALYGAVYYLLLTDPAQLDAEFAEGLVAQVAGDHATPSLDGLGADRGGVSPPA
jgi:AcrR family transcriptional regulator